MLRLQDPEIEYKKDKKLKKEDVEALLMWAKKQPHLPEITETQVILFLQSCYYSNETAKTSIDTFFTVKTLFPDLFKSRNPLDPQIRKLMDLSLITFLPKKTPEGHTIIFMKFIDLNSDEFNVIDYGKYFDMVITLNLLQKGTSEGHVLVIDVKGCHLGHMGKLIKAGPTFLKKYLFYLQEAVPIRLKGWHIFNIPSFIDKTIALMRPFLKSEVLNMFQLHDSVDNLLKFVPLDCLPEEYGGSVESSAILLEKVKKELGENSELFEWEDGLVVDETKRAKKLKSVEDVFGVDGTFKKLEID